MQLTTFQVLDIAIDCLLFGSLLFVLLDFIRVLPSMIRASWAEALAKENEVVVKNVATTTKPKKSRRKKSHRRRKSKAVQMELLPNGTIPRATSESSTTRLTFKKVQVDFSDKGFTLNRFPSSRFRYRVADLPNCRFKKLEEAMDWLDEQPEPLEVPKHHQLELLDTVMV